MQALLIFAERAETMTNDIPQEWRDYIAARQRATGLTEDAAVRAFLLSQEGA
jgi:hypothetical protein